MVERHGSQCGFCTPGIVMALYGLWMATSSATVVIDVETALQGNLCRCTGYEPIVKAGRVAAAKAGGRALDGLPERGASETVRTRLSGMAGGIVASGAATDAPSSPRRSTISRRPWSRTPTQYSSRARPISVFSIPTKSLRAISPGVFIGHLMKEIVVSDAELRIGAGVTSSRIPARRSKPSAGGRRLRAARRRLAGSQRGTIGGNIANGSPDRRSAAVVDRARLPDRFAARLLSTRDRAGAFFIEYGKQDRAPGEFVETVVIPRPRGARIAAYKVSNRAVRRFRGIGLFLRPREERSDP